MGRWVHNDYTGEHLLDCSLSEKIQGQVQQTIILGRRNDHQDIKIVIYEYIARIC